MEYIEDEIGLSLAGETIEIVLMRMRQNIENMTYKPSPPMSKSLLKKKFENKLERAILRMAKLGTVDEEEEEITREAEASVENVEKKTAKTEMSMRTIGEAESSSEKITPRVFLVLE